MISSAADFKRPSKPLARLSQPISDSRLLTIDSTADFLKCRALCIVQPENESIFRSESSEGFLDSDDLFGLVIDPAGDYLGQRLIQRHKPLGGS